MTERPSTIQKRKDLVIVNTETERKKKTDSFPPLKEFINSDFPVIKLPYRKEPTQPYGAGFPLYLVGLLRKLPFKDVKKTLHVCFPECDEMDCEYLEEVLEELQLQIKRVRDRPMSPYTRWGELFIANAAKVNNWIAKQHLRLAKEAGGGKNLMEATLPFHGTISSVVELLYRLERRGSISILTYRNNHGKLGDLALTLCGVFPPTGSSSKNVAQAIERELRKIPISKLGPGPIDENVLAGMGKKRSTYEPNSVSGAD